MTATMMMHPFRAGRLARRTLLRAALLLCAVLSLYATAADIAWTNAVGGAFSVADNWNPNTVPGVGDTAVFNLADADPYTVTWTESVENQKAKAEEGTLTWVLGGHTYELIALDAFGADAKTLNLVVSNGEIKLPNAQYTIRGNTTVQFGPDLTGYIGRLLDAGGILSGATMLVDNADLTSHRIIIADGGSVVLTNGATLSTGGNFSEVQNGATLRLAGAGTYMYTNLGSTRTIKGTVVIESGAELRTFGTSSALTVINGGRVVLNDGVLSVFRTPSIHNHQGIIEGKGTIEPFSTPSGISLYNKGGWIRPGSTNATGVLTFDGDFYNSEDSVGGTIKIELGGKAAEQFDRFVVVGAFHAAGTLSVSLINGFQPAYKDTFNILDFTTLSGTFEDYVLPGGTGHWDLSDLYTTGEIRYVRPVGTLICVQ